MVTSYHVVPYLQYCYAWVITSSATCNYLMCHINVTLYNTDVLRVLLIYLHSPLGTACHQESCIYTVQYKILEGENLGKFGELEEIHQNFLSKTFLPKSTSIQCITRYSS